MWECVWECVCVCESVCEGDSGWLKREKKLVSVVYHSWQMSKLKGNPSSSASSGVLHKSTKKLKLGYFWFHLPSDAAWADRLLFPQIWLQLFSVELNYVKFRRTPVEETDPSLAESWSKKRVTFAILNAVQLWMLVWLRVCPERPELLHELLFVLTKQPREEINEKTRSYTRRFIHTSWWGKRQG